MGSVPIPFQGRLFTLSHLPVKGEAAGERERTEREREREREAVKARSRGRGFFVFLNKVQTPAESNKTVQLLSLLTQANLSGTPEAWLVNMNCNSLVDLTAAAGVKSVARLPHGGGSVNYKKKMKR